MSSLHAILQSSASLVSHIDTQGLPSLHRNIAQLEEESRRLARANGGGGGGGGVVTAQTEAEAQIFLSSRGIDVGKHSRQLRKIDLSKAYEPLDALSDLEVERFLQHQHAMLVSTAIEESATLTADDCRRAHVDRLEADWEAAKKDLLEAMGYQAATAAADSYAPHHASFAGDGGNPNASSSASASASASFAAGRAHMLHHGPKSHLSPAALRYGDVVRRLNEDDGGRNNAGARDGGGGGGGGDVPDAVREFQAAAAELEEAGVTSPDAGVSGSWGLLGHMVRGAAEKTAVPARAGAFREEYLQDGGDLRRGLVAGARRFTELLFRRHLEDTVRSKGKQTRGGDLGRASLESHIKTYVAVEFRGRGGRWPDGFEDMAPDAEYPRWPLAFYAFRCGDLELAARMAAGRDGRGEGAASANAADASAAAPFQKLVDALSHMAHRVRNPRNTGAALPEDLWSALDKEYKQRRVSPDGDPFKYALYNLVGRCEPKPRFHDLVKPTVEDWVWLRLTQLWEEDEQPPSWLCRGPPNTLHALQHEVLNRGGDPESAVRAWTEGGANPLLFFNVLLMCQLFEDAAAFLVRTGLFTEGVHFALALDHFGLLRHPDERQPELLARSRDGYRTLDVARVVQKYLEAHAVAKHDAELAFHYILRLRGADGSMHRLLVALLLGTMDLERLVGAWSADGQRVERPGCLRRFLPGHAAAIVSEAAAQADTNGDHLDAVRLYALAENRAKLTEVLMERLSLMVVTAPSVRERQEMRHTAVGFVDRGVVGEAGAQSLRKLLHVMDYFDLYQQGPARYDEAIQCIESLGLVPSSSDPADLDIKMQLFNKVDLKVRRCFADVALSCMDMYFFKYQSIREELERGRKRGRAPDRSRAAILAKYRDKARALVDFVGMVDMYSPDVKAKLLRLETGMV